MAGRIPGPTWEGLLKWSITNSDGSQQTPPRQISEEDRKWFNEAMQGQTIDVIRRMKEISVVMNTPQHILDQQGVTTEEQEGLLEELQEHVESIDMASDLHAIGGLVPLINCLKNPHASIRARAAEVVSTIVQNNPKSQQQVMDVKGLQLLLHNFTSDDDLNVRAKALGAISSLIRHNKAGASAFRLANGYAGLRDALSSGHLRLQRKGLQVILYLLQEYPKDANVVTDLGFPPALTNLVSSSDGDIRSAALSALVEISRKGQVVVGNQSNDQLKQVLSKRIDDVEQYEDDDKLAAKEECYIIDSLWRLSFKEPSPLNGSALLLSEPNEQQQDVDIAISAGGSSEAEVQSLDKSKTASLKLLGPS